MLLCSCQNDSSETYDFYTETVTESSITDTQTYSLETDINIRNISATELKISDTLKYYMDKYALLESSYDEDTDGYVLNCYGCKYWAENAEELTVSKIFSAAQIYQEYGLKITGIYIELPVSEKIDIGEFKYLKTFECMSTDVSGITCSSTLDNLEDFSLYYVQGQEEQIILDVCQILEYHTPNIKTITIDGIYTKEYPNLVNYLKSLYDISIFDEGIIYTQNG